MKKLMVSVYTLLLLCMVGLSPASAKTVDRIVAVAGNEVVFSSELDERVMMTRMQFPELKNDRNLRVRLGPVAGIVDIPDKHPANIDGGPVERVAVAGTMAAGVHAPRRVPRQVGPHEIYKPQCHPAR